MFETAQRRTDRPEDRTITVFLNRACPRTCYQCGIADNSRKPMKGAQWREAVDILQDLFGATFILFLGVEPLLLGQDFVDLVAHLSRKKLDAAWYTTSPEPLFTKWRQALVDAGLQNWSSGVDTLPHLPALDPETDKKSKESIIGLQWMAERGIPTHVTTTIHKRNLATVPEIAEWIYSNIPGVEYAVNFIEWRKDPAFDFFSKPEDMADMLWDNTAEERIQIREVMRQVLAITKKFDLKVTECGHCKGEGLLNGWQCSSCKGSGLATVRKVSRRFHTAENYLTNAHLFYSKLDLHCQGAIGPSVDADGTMRLCGYSTGWESGQTNVLDLKDPKRAAEFNKAWTRDLWKCSGCYWACFRLPDPLMKPWPHDQNKAPNAQALLQLKKGK